MDVWHLLLYAVASFLALRTLLGLMADHRRRYLQELTAQYQAERRLKAKQAKKQAQAQQQQAENPPPKRAA